MKTVIYKKNGVYHTTPLSNFTARVSNALAVHNMSEFPTVKTIIDYYHMYFGSNSEDFVIAINGRLYEYVAYDEDAEEYAVLDDGGNTWYFEEGDIV